MEIAAIVISALSAVISIFALQQASKKVYVELASKERLTWAANVRELLNAYFAAFYAGEDLRVCEAKILLFLNTENEKPNLKHVGLAEALRDVTSGKEKKLDRVICEAQKLLNWNWRTVKRESAGIGISQYVPGNQDPLW